MAGFRSGMPGLFLRLSASTSVASGSPIPYDTVDWEEQWPSWTGGVLEVPRTGTYAVTAGWEVLAAGPAQTKDVALFINGVDTGFGTLYLSSTVLLRGCVSALVRVDQGDLISLRSTQGLGAARTWSADHNRIHVARVGPERWT